MPRIILTHSAELMSEKLLLRSIDEPGPGGGYHHYEISLDDVDDPKRDGNPGQPRTLATIRFQKGPVGQPDSVAGVTNESLLAIVIDRLECFQAGPFACVENEEALKKVRVGLDFLLARTRKRMARGVEGTMQK